MPRAKVDTIEMPLQMRNEDQRFKLKPRYSSSERAGGSEHSLEALLCADAKRDEKGDISACFRCLPVGVPNLGCNILR